MSARSFALLALFVSAPSWAGRAYIAGEVVDRSGNPVSRATISLTPGNVELITDDRGRFLIDYLRDDSGQRVRLERRTEYEIEVFKPGFHIETVSLSYRTGGVTLEPLHLSEEAIKVNDDGANLDPELFSDHTDTSGANYEGQ